MSPSHHNPCSLWRWGWGSLRCHFACERASEQVKSVALSGDEAARRPGKSCLLWSPPGSPPLGAIGLGLSASSAPQNPCRRHPWAAPTQEAGCMRCQLGCSLPLDSPSLDMAPSKCHNHGKSPSARPSHVGQRLCALGAEDRVSQGKSGESSPRSGQPGKAERGSPLCPSSCRSALLAALGSSPGGGLMLSI